MGLVYEQIELINTGDLELAYRGFLSESSVKRQKVNALVDSGSYMLAINEHVRNQLDLRTLDKQEVVLADGTLKEFEIVGPIDIRFENRATTTRAFVLPGETEVLLGSIPMGDMDVLIDRRQEKLVVNPANPYMPKKYLK